jgi:hypothetical protein
MRALMISVVSAVFLLTSPRSFSSVQTMESLVCLDSDGFVRVTFNLEGAKLTQLRFFARDGSLLREIPQFEAKKGKFLGRTYYELSLGTVAYFDFEKTKHSVGYSGAFLLKNGFKAAFSAETNVECSVVEHASF